MPQAHAQSADALSVYRPSREARRKNDGMECPLCGIHIHWKDLVVYGPTEVHIQCLILISEGEHVASE